MRKFLSTFTFLILLLSQLSLLMTSPLEAAKKTPEIKIEEESNTGKVLSGRKVGIVTPQKEDHIVQGRFVVIMKESSYEKSKAVASSVGASITFEDNNVYSGVRALPINFTGLTPQEIEGKLRELNTDPDVLIIEPVYKRYLSAIVPDDPLIPDNNCSGSLWSSSCQWHFNESSGGNYGIDLLDAWDYMDGAQDGNINFADPTNYGGSATTVVAVIDTGVAFENYDDVDGSGGLKYNDYGLMSAPDGWDFDKATDLTDNIYTNTGETDFNQVDDDLAGAEKYCLDANDDNECDVGETKGRYFDDRHGVNLIDQFLFYDSTNYYTSGSGAATFGSACTNVGYTDHTCVSNRYCDVASQSNTSYYGCQPSDMGHPNDSMGHGTYVSSLIASKTNNTIGGVGVAPGVQILPIQIFHYIYSGGEWIMGGGTSDMVARSVQYAVDAGADVVNMSFGGPGSSVYEETVMNAAYNDSDVLLIAASGNCTWGCGTVESPAGYESVMAVGASDKDGTRVSYSSYGDHVELVAPVAYGAVAQSYSCYFDAGDGDNDVCMGDDTNAVLAPAHPSYPPDLFSSTEFSFGNSAGTSFAAPQAAGVAALVRSKYPTMTASHTRYVLANSTSNYPLEHSIYTGNGILNAENAVKAVTEDGGSLSSETRLLIAVRGGSTGIYSKYSGDNALSWPGWEGSGFTQETPQLIQDSVTGNVLMVVRGNSDTAYSRYSTDSGDIWSDWMSLGGKLADEPVLIQAGSGRVFVFGRMTNNGIGQAYSDDGGATWSSWTSSGLTPSALNASYSTNGSVLSVVVRGMNNGIYTKYSTNNGTTWGDWFKEGKTVNPIATVYDSISGNTIQSTVGTNSGVYARISTDGGVTWGGWSSNSTGKGEITLERQGGTIVQAVRGISNTVDVRYSINGGVSWSSWSKTGRIASRVELGSSGNLMIMSAINDRKNIYTRVSTDNGHTWGDWEQVGRSNGGMTLYGLSNGRILHVVQGASDGVYRRLYDPGTSSWGDWAIDGQTINRIAVQEVIL